MKRVLYEPDHHMYRSSVRAFLESEVVPHYPQWEQEHLTPRELFGKAGELGAFAAIPEEYGGDSLADFRYNAIINEEATALGVIGAVEGIVVHADLCLPYFIEACTPDQRSRWMPGLASGELIAGIAMTEPGAGSDLAGISTTAVRDGDHYVVNGAKTFISNGINGDIFITVVRTAEDRHRGLSLIVIERGTPGFERGRKLDKVGLHAQDTAELFFSDARVPAENLLGNEGEGFFALTRNLAQERMSVAVTAVARAKAVLDWSVAYAKERHAFGKPIADQQYLRFRLAELDTDVDLAQQFLDRAIMDLTTGELSPVDAAKAKWWSTELEGRAVDLGVQIHGGYGYMLEYPIARAYIDARVSRIYGGTTEIMKEIVGRALLK